MFMSSEPLEQITLRAVMRFMMNDLDSARRQRLFRALSEARLRVADREEQARQIHAQFLEAREALSQAQVELADAQRLYNQLPIVM